MINNVPQIATFSRGQHYTILKSLVLKFLSLFFIFFMTSKHNFLTVNFIKVQRILKQGNNPDNKRIEINSRQTFLTSLSPSIS